MTKNSIQFEAIGTHWQIDILDSSVLDQTNFFIKIKKRIEEFEQTYSRFREDSWFSKMVSKPGNYVLPYDAKPLFDLYYDLYALTQGVFTPLIGQTLVDAGYDAKYSLKQKEIIAQPSPWEDVLDYDFPNLTVKQKTVLDFGACGKGYIIDIVSKMLEDAKIEHFCVDAGGDIFYKNNGQEKMRVGLENPNDFSQVIGVAEICNQSICASSGSRRKWGRFNHIINPKTLESPKNILATWVIADSAMLADALATCLYMVDKEILLEVYSFQYVILYADNNVDVSKDFHGELFFV